MAELLISLAILGVIATFTIPKIVQNSRNSQNSALAKEVASMMVNAFDQYRKNNTITSSTNVFAALTPYLNYVSVDTTSSMDDHALANANYVCGGSLTCLKTHGGGTLFFDQNQRFDVTNPSNSILFFYDPDSRQTGEFTDSPGKSVCFVLQYNGRITSRALVVAGTPWGTGGQTLLPANHDPSWFSWNSTP